jgi:hypothetical protein
VEVVGTSVVDVVGTSVVEVVGSSVVEVVGASVVDVVGSAVVEVVGSAVVEVVDVVGAAVDVEDVVSASVVDVVGVCVVVVASAVVDVVVAPAIVVVVGGARVVVVVVGHAPSRGAQTRRYLSLSFRGFATVVIARAVNLSFPGFFFPFFDTLTGTVSGTNAPQAEPASMTGTGIASCETRAIERLAGGVQPGRPGLLTQIRTLKRHESLQAPSPSHAGSPSVHVSAWCASVAVPFVSSTM